MSSASRPLPDLAIIAQACRVARAYRFAQSARSAEAHSKHMEILLQEIDELANRLIDEAPASMFLARQA